MRMHLIVVAIKNVETMLLRHASRVATTATPLAKTARGVADSLEHRGDRWFTGT